MTPNDAMSLCVRLKAHFPRTSDDLLDEWQDRFEEFHLAIARQCVGRYVEKHDELRTSILLAELRNATVRAADTRPARVEEERQIQAEWAEIDAAMGEMSDEELAEHKRTVLEQLPPTSRMLLAKSDPRISRPLKGLIANNLAAAVIRRTAHAVHEPNN